MADITPFKGTLYNKELIKDLTKVMAPPYDVISSSEQGELYKADPHNIIRILLGEDFPGDSQNDNKYTRAKAFLDEWQKKDILQKDKDECIYAYLQEFTVDNNIKRRLGFIALLKLEDFDTKRRSVYPHENTLLAPKKDRSSLLASIQANLGPIFVLFADEDKSIDAILAQNIKSQPIIDIQDRYGIRNRLWRIADKKTIADIISLMKKEKIFIADGHHRYEVGLAYSKTKTQDKYKYILSYFTDLYAEGIVILPVHRLIKGVSKEALSSFEKKIEKDFSIEEIASKQNIKPFLSQATPLEKRFVIYDGRSFIGLKAKNKKDSLDVAILHDLIIKPLGNISIDFSKDLDYAVNEVDKKRYSLSIILNPTKITQIRDVAFSGRRMPQKSTYFYPKVLTGLVINVF